ncbi:hypothetical protein WN943_018762 [Citrus x changshan-huyou]
MAFVIPIVALGSHCLDIQPVTEDDPEWLVMQRKIEVDMVHDWILKYFADLLQNQSIRLYWSIFCEVNDCILGCVAQSLVFIHLFMICDFKHWGGGGATAAPILAYLGEESSLDDDLGGTGWLTDNAH